MASIQGVYLALFGRPADPIGLQYFNQQTNNGADLSRIGDLASTPEYQTRFAGLSNVQIINSIYQSLFARDADLAGLTFFTNALANGTFNINNIAIAIFDGAQGTDVTVRDTKVAAANSFTAAIDTTAEVVGYQGEAAAADGRAFIQSVTTTAPTADQVTAAVAAATDGVNPGTPALTLTSGLDALVGTNANDTFQGDVANLGAFDSINGGTGIDTLNLIGAGNADLNANATIQNVEIVNIATTQAVTNLSTDSFAGVQQLWQIGVAGDVSVGDSAVTLGFRNTALGVNLTVQDAVTSTTVALDNATTGGTLNFAETTTNDLSSVTVNGSVAGAGALTLTTGAADLDTINLGLTSNGTVTVSSFTTDVSSINASASTGNLTIDASAVTELATFTGGSGNDVLTANHAALTSATFTLSAGAGTDTINFDIDAGANSTASVLTGGAGGDTFNISATTGNLSAAAIADNDGLLANLVTVSDFTASEDVLNLSGLTAVTGGQTAQNVVNNAVTAAAATTLLDAVTAVAGVTADNGYSVFSFNSNTYIFAESGAADGLDTGDTVIQLTGVTVASLTADNLIA